MTCPRSLQSDSARGRWVTAGEEPCVERLSAQTRELAVEKLVVAERRCSAACWDSVASHLSLSRGSFVEK